MTTGAEVEAALEYRVRVGAMLDDPDLTGDQLLLAVALYHVLVREQTETGRMRMSRRGWVEAVARVCGWTTWRKVAWTIGHDYPRYEPDHDRSWDRVCEAPMIRREGVCGQRGGSGNLIYDPVTGERHYAVSCSRHRSWAEHVARTTRQAWRDAGSPEPPHNAGGVLARHFGGDWAVIYRWAEPWRKETPGDGKPPTPPRPKLLLIRGEATP